MFFANVSDEPVTAKVGLDPAAYGIRARKLACEISADGEAGSGRLPISLVPQQVLEHGVTFKPMKTEAWEFRW